MPQDFDPSKPFTTVAPDTKAPSFVPIQLPNGKEITTQADFDRLHPALQKKLRDAQGYEVDENGEPLSNASEGWAGVIHKVAHDLDPINVATKFGRDFTKSIDNQGGWGLSQDTRQKMGAGNPDIPSILQPVTNTPADLVDASYRALQTVAGGLNALPRVVLPDSIVDDPVLGALAVGEGGVASHPALDMAAVKQALAEGSVDDIVSAYHASGSPVDTAVVKKYVRTRDSGGRVGDTPEVIEGKTPAAPEAPSAPPAPANDTSAPPAPSTPDPINDRIDELDDLMANTHPDDPRQVDWENEQDALMKQDQANRDAQTPNNDNSPVTSEDKLMKAEKEYNDHVYGDDEARLARKSTKVRKAWEQKSTDLEDEYRAAAADHLKTIPDDELNQFNDSMRGAGHPFAEEVRNEWERRAKEETYNKAATDTPDVVTRLTKALQTAGKASKEQQTLYSQVRAERFSKLRQIQASTSGEEGLHMELGSLKGELPKADFQPIRDQFSDGDITELFDKVKATPGMQGLDGMNARVALSKMMDGKVPTPSEMKLLSQVFPADFIKAASHPKSGLSTLMDVPGRLAATSRAMMTTIDLSFPFTQGWAMAGRPEFYKTFAPMIKQFAKGFGKSDEAFNGFMKDIKTDPDYATLKDAGVAFTDKHGGVTPEEAFGNGYQDHIPVFGRASKASEKAFLAFSNKLKLDVGKSMLRDAKTAGIDTQDEHFLDSLSKMVNTGTGRGDLGKWEPAAGPLATALFSPRLMASRINLLNPKFYYDLHPFARKELLKSVAGAGAIAVTVATLAKHAGAKVTTDPRSTDFGKVRVGDTRYSIFGGLSNYVTLGARLATNETTDAKGVTRTLGQKYGDRTRADVLTDFAGNKLAPIPGAVMQYWKGKNADGTKFDAGKAAANLVTPLFPKDAYDAMKSNGVPEGILMSIPGLFGVGMQTYPDRNKFDPKAPFKVQEAAPTSAPVDTGFDPTKPFDTKAPEFDPSQGFEETTDSNLKASDVLTKIGLRITDNGVRSHNTQKRLHDTTVGAAAPGHSDHELGNAIDVAPSSKVRPEDIVATLEAQGFKGVTMITKKHGTGPHWHIQWDSYN